MTVDAMGHSPALCTVAAALAAAAACVATAQEPQPARLSVASFAGDATVEMTLAWRFHPGDDPSFAAPELDDGGWAPIDPLRLAPAAAAPGWSGSGWFRRHLVIDGRLLGVPLILRVEAPGAAAVFLDGRPLVRSGDGTAGAPAGVSSARVQVTFPPPADHVLAVRYEAGKSANAAPGAEPGFHLTFEEVGAQARRLASEQRRSVAEIVFMVFPASLALLHLALFWAYPKARENLFYALWMMAFAFVVLCNHLAHALATESARQLLARLAIFPVMAGLLFVLLTYYAIRTRPFPKSWRFFAALAAAVAIVAAIVGRGLPGRAWYVYLAAMAIEVVRVERSRRTLPRSDLGIVLWAMLVQFAVAVVVILSNIGILPAPLGDNTYFVIPLPLAIGMSIFLARSFGRTNLDLERRLTEVEQLSGQVLVQERAAHAQEMSRRLLEAEHARTEAEVEAARSLQLSMLPSALPAVPGLELGALMLTASEVGGDYYDFREDGGGLVLAVGDATGHGVAAGIMVTAVKALFASRTLPADLAGTAAECNRVLRAMNLRPLHMCLTLARVTPRSIAVCNAAMPPVLIHRAASGTVEELGRGGLPLGSRLDAHWEEDAARLEPGDTLLLASDGLVELEDATGAALGFEGAAHALRQAAGAPAAEVIRRLVSAAAAWRGDRPQSDDLTLVVVRVAP